MQIYALAARPQLQRETARPAPSVRGLCWSLDFSRAPRRSPHFLRNMARDLGTTSDHQVMKMGPSVTQFGAFTSTQT